MLTQHALKESDEIGAVLDHQDRGKVGSLGSGRCVHRDQTYERSRRPPDLESSDVARFLWSVPELLPRPFRPALATPSIVVGTVASAATAGALVAMGHRLGRIGVAFAEISAAVFRRTASGGEAGLVFTGLVLHVALTMLWSAVFVWLVARARWRPMIAAAIIAIGTHVLSWLVAWSTGRGIASVLALGDRIVLAVVLAVSLVVGIRFALVPGEMRE